MKVFKGYHLNFVVPGCLATVQVTPLSPCCAQQNIGIYWKKSEIKFFWVSMIPSGKIDFLLKNPFNLL